MLTACVEEHEWAATVVERTLLLSFMSALFICSLGVLAYGALRSEIYKLFGADANA